MKQPPHGTEVTVEIGPGGGSYELVEAILGHGVSWQAGSAIRRIDAGHHRRLLFERMGSDQGPGLTEVTFASEAEDGGRTAWTVAFAWCPEDELVSFGAWISDGPMWMVNLQVAREAAPMQCIQAEHEQSAKKDCSPWRTVLGRNADLQGGYAQLAEGRKPEVAESFRNAIRLGEEVETCADGTKLRWCVTSCAPKLRAKILVLAVGKEEKSGGDTEFPITPCSYDSNLVRKLEERMAERMVKQQCSLAAAELSWEVCDPDNLRRAPEAIRMAFLGLLESAAAKHCCEVFGCAGVGPADTDGDGIRATVLAWGMALVRFWEMALGLGGLGGSDAEARFTCRVSRLEAAKLLPSEMEAGIAEAGWPAEKELMKELSLQVDRLRQGYCEVEKASLQQSCHWPGAFFAKRARSEYDQETCVEMLIWQLLRDALAALLVQTDQHADQLYYNARSRQIFLNAAERLQVPGYMVNVWEQEIGEELYATLHSSLTEGREQRWLRRGRFGRRLRIGLAAGLGGATLALSGGFAAPGLAAVVGATVGTAAAGATALLTPTAAAVLFGAGGASLTGWKLGKRWGEIRQFEFARVPTCDKLDTFPADASESSDQHRQQGYIDSAYDFRESVACEEPVMPCELSEEHGMYSEGQSRPVPRGGRQHRSSDGTNYSTVVTDETSNKDEDTPALHLTVCVTGWLREENDALELWKHALPPAITSESYVLRWETDLLKAFGYTIGEEMKAQAIKRATNFWLQQAVAGLPAAGSLAWPVWLVGALSRLDNTWHVARERSKQAGRLLAETLLNRRTFGGRPVCLMGYSIGARVVFYALQELWQRRAFHVVSDVFILGTPVSAPGGPCAGRIMRQWQQVRSVVSGRFVNCYSSRDWMLGFLCRYMEWDVRVAGLGPVGVLGVRDVDLSSLIAAHSEYPDKLQTALLLMEISREDPLVL